MGDKMIELDEPKYKQAIKMLYDNGIMCEAVRDEENDIKLAVEGEFNFFDYYPSTGRWVQRLSHEYLSTAREGFSLLKLINYIKDQ